MLKTKDSRRNFVGLSFVGLVYTTLFVLFCLTFGFWVSFIGFLCVSGAIVVIGVLTHLIGGWINRGQGY